MKSSVENSVQWCFIYLLPLRRKLSPKVATDFCIGVQEIPTKFLRKEKQVRVYAYYFLNLIIGNILIQIL